MTDQQRDIAAAFTQRCKVQAQNVQAEVKVRAESVVARQAVDILVGRSDYLEVGSLESVGADRAVGPLL